MSTLEKMVKELRRQYEEGRGELGWLDYKDGDEFAIIDGRVDLERLAAAVDA